MPPPSPVKLSFLEEPLRGCRRFRRGCLWIQPGSAPARLPGGPQGVQCLWWGRRDPAGSRLLPGHCGFLLAAPRSGAPPWHPPGLPRGTPTPCLAADRAAPLGLCAASGAVQLTPCF